MKKYLPTSKRSSGFTLVELLVVISIIAILSVIGISVFTGVQKNARDAQRKADIDAITKALEVNKTDSGYVILADTQFASGSIPTGDVQGNHYCANTAKDDQPKDPVSWTTACPTNYKQVSKGIPLAGIAWKVCAWLEASKAYCRVSTQ